MEVHQHTHSPGKKWTNYLWEFLMLFLAVFCGFLAENIRENRVEKERGKQYIHSLYEDLKADITKLTSVINDDNKKISALKSMRACYDTVSKNWKNTDCMAELVRYSKVNRAFQLTDRTLRQLANAGGFRLLEKRDADSILGYEGAFKQYQNFESTVFQEAQDYVRNTLNQLADFRVISPFQYNTPAQGMDTSKLKLEGPLLYANDPALLNKWFNELSLYLRVINGQRGILTALKGRATNLVGYFSKKYHLE